MSRQSQTELAVLGALSVEPMTGYALRQAIAGTLGHFWSESFGQIYPALARLEADGLIEPPADGRTSGQVFALTRTGRRRLRELLRQPIAAPPPRNGTLLRLFFGDLLAPDERRGLVEEARERAAASLASLSVLRRELEAEIAAGADAGAPYRLMTLSAGEHTARAQLAWADETLVALDQDGTG
jgi:DNA-binding PadR family transcriptional regulator